jgi:hypothetical protein
MQEPFWQKSKSKSNVLCQHGSIAFNFISNSSILKINEVEVSIHGIVKTLDMLGYRLWYGYLHRDVFLNKVANKGYMLSATEKIVDALIAQRDPGFTSLDPDKQLEINDIIEPQGLKDVTFARYLTKLAITEDWKNPSIFTRDLDKEMQQKTGRTRAFATSMTRAEPWLHYPVFLLDHESNNIDNILLNPIHCHNDDILHEVFGKKLKDSTQNLELVIEINVIYTRSMIHCSIFGVYDYDDKHQGLGGDLLDGHVAWRKNYGLRPALCIRTNCPENIKGYNKHWDTTIEPLGLDQDFINECVKRPAWFERVVRDYHTNLADGPSTHVLWVLDDCVVNLDELAWWSNNDFNVLIDSDWKCILYSPSKTYSSTIIKISQDKYSHA